MFVYCVCMVGKVMSLLLCTWKHLKTSNSRIITFPYTIEIMVIFLSKCKFKMNIFTAVWENKLNRTVHLTQMFIFLCSSFLFRTYVHARSVWENIKHSPWNLGTKFNFSTVCKKHFFNGNMLCFLLALKEFVRENKLRHVFLYCSC